eukprot:CAMPEP_0172481176 /NCGR_PEP_ID=MMETSP1066-20121228/6842_1 /TAXON_ID=671091 /ORGANISM="Coscinodiscus wailesii, Strain CCMP2513" /LENGTH=109 /DNA_ID=CAMNT_0013243201 /DNA_START=34 /DNA_END=360 /DNA_ORIENTATION=-
MTTEAEADAGMHTAPNTPTEANSARTNHATVPDTPTVAEADAGMHAAPNTPTEADIARTNHATVPDIPTEADNAGPHAIGYNMNAHNDALIAKSIAATTTMIVVNANPM